MEFTGQYRCSKCAEVYPYKIAVCPSCGGGCAIVPGSHSNDKCSSEIDIASSYNKRDLVCAISSVLKGLGLTVKDLEKNVNCGLDLWCEFSGRRIGIKVPFGEDRDFVGIDDVKDALAGKAIYECESVVIASTNAFSHDAFNCSNRTGVILRCPTDLPRYIQEVFGLSQLDSQAETSSFHKGREKPIEKGESTRVGESIKRDLWIVRAGCGGWIKDIKVPDGCYVHMGRDIVDVDFYGILKVPSSAQQTGYVRLKCSNGQLVKFGQELAEIKKSM